MELNLNEKYIEFSVVGTDDKITTSFTMKQLQTDDNLVYRLGISLCNPGDCFKLLDFEYSHS